MSEGREIKSLFASGIMGVGRGGGGGRGRLRGVGGVGRHRLAGPVQTTEPDRPEGRELGRKRRIHCCSSLPCTALPSTALPFPCRKSDSWSGIRRTLGGHAGTACSTAAAAAARAARDCGDCSERSHRRLSVTFRRFTGHLRVLRRTRKSAVSLSRFAHQRGTFGQFDHYLNNTIHWGTLHAHILDKQGTPYTEEAEQAQNATFIDPEHVCW